MSSEVDVDAVGVPARSESDTSGETNVHDATNTAARETDIPNVQNIEHVKSPRCQSNCNLTDDQTVNFENLKSFGERSSNSDPTEVKVLDDTETEIGIQRGQNLVLRDSNTHRVQTTANTETCMLYDQDFTTRDKNVYSSNNILTQDVSVPNSDYTTKTGNTMNYNERNSSVCSEILPTETSPMAQSRIGYSGECLEELVVPAAPPKEWRLNHLLHRIGSSLNEKELYQLKELFRGNGGIGKRVREECDTHAKFFGVLRESMYITPACMLYLNKMLYTIKRTDLTKEVVKYCREIGNVLYFTECPEQPEEGNEFVKFHVKGKDFKSCTAESVRRLRDRVADIVCAPHCDILMAGIEPGLSLLVTLMMPSEFGFILQELLDRREPLLELLELGVDLIYLRDVTYTIEDTQREMSETEQQLQLMSVYAQNKKLSEQLENSQLESIRQKEEISRALQEKEVLRMKLLEHTSLEEENKEQLRVMRVLTESLQLMHITSPNGRSVINELKMELENAAKKGFDMPFIKKVLRHNTVIVSSYMREQYLKKCRQMELNYATRRVNALQLQHWTLTGLQSSEQLLHQYYNSVLPGQRLRINKNVSDILMEISTSLQPHERKALADHYVWLEGDIIKTCIDSDASLFLIGLECKEAEVTQEKVQTAGFMKRMLHSIDRYDLNERLECRLRQQAQSLSQSCGTLYFVDGIDSLYPVITLLEMVLVNLYNIVFKKKTLEFAESTTDATQYFEHTEVIRQRGG